MSGEVVVVVVVVVGISLGHRWALRMLQQIFVRSKDKSLKELSCVISCNECEIAYIGVTARLKTKFLEHHRLGSTSSEVSKHLHADCLGYSIKLDSAKVLDTEANLYETGVKEAIYFRAHMPSLNKDGGRHQLSSLNEHPESQPMSRAGPDD